MYLVSVANVCAFDLLAFATRRLPLPIAPSPFALAQVLPSEAHDRGTAGANKPARGAGPNAARLPPTMGQRCDIDIDDCSFYVATGHSLNPAAPGTGTLTDLEAIWLSATLLA